jgi:hypothetical protein
MAAILFARRACTRAAWALAAGAALGIAVLVRPTNALLLVPMAFALPLRRGPLWLFAAGAAPFALMLAVYNQRCYGNFGRSGYDVTGLSEAFAWSHFPPRFAYYGGHVLETLAYVVPIAWLALLLDRKTPARDRALLISWFTAFFGFFCFYGPYESFIFVRFLLPGIPALILGAALVIQRWGSAPGALRFAPAAILLVVIAVEVRATRRLGVLGVIGDQSTYPESCRWAQRVLPPKSALLAMQTSGALEYYTDTTYVMWNWIDSSSFRALRSRVEQRGWRWFALLLPDEKEEFFKRLPGSWKNLGELRGVTLWKLEP